MRAASSAPATSGGAATAASAAPAGSTTQAPASGAQGAADANGPTLPSEYIQVTSTRIPEPAETIPASVSVVTGQDMINRGARDLRDALALVVGLDVAPGGDGGPASFVPELWGLKEFDAFLLVVDGVPWGGAFNPALSTLDLRDVERIEVMHGPAPVMYGATSFVGVIQVIRFPAGTGRPAVTASAGSYNSGSIAGRIPIPLGGTPGSGLVSTLLVDLEQVGFRDDRTSFDREHLLWRASIPALSGTLNLDVEGVWVQQEPASPVPRQGSELSPLTPLDTNYNPGGSKIDEQRLVATGVYDRPLDDKSRWVTTLSGSYANQDVIRGFLTDVSNTDPNANGFRQTVDLLDIYFDSHMELTGSPRYKLVFGIDDMYGDGDADGGDFDYFVPLDGDNPPSGKSIPFGGTADISGTRNYAGLYGQVEWYPFPAWRFDLGLRLNQTHEERKTTSQEDGFPAESASDSVSNTRGSGTVGVTWTVWTHDANAVRLYANASNTFKPAAFDFGLDAEPEILAPETAISYEGGVKWAFMGGRVNTGLDVFQMDFKNLVVSTDIGGVPGLESVGQSRLRGLEADIAWQMQHDMMLQVNYSLHDPRFEDYETDFDGTATQLEGNRLEMAARYMAAAGFTYSPLRGFRGSVQINWVGSRYLNKRNTALTGDYATWSAGVGYRWSNWEVRLDGYNINDQRPPVTESELGESQYYLLPARRIIASASYQF